MKFITFETWTRIGMVEADSINEAYEKSGPGAPPEPGMNLGNWWVVPVDSSVEQHTFKTDEDPGDETSYGHGV